MKQAHAVFSLARRKQLDVAKTRSMGESLNAFCLIKHFLELLEDIECIAYELDSFMKLASATNDDPSTELAYESEYINQLVSNAKKANAVVTSALASVARFTL